MVIISFFVCYFAKYLEIRGDASKLHSLKLSHYVLRKVDNSDHQG